jgi:hypothetical protein
MEKKYLAFLIAMLLSCTLWSQNLTFHTEKLSPIAPLGVAALNDSSPDFFPQLQRIEAPKPSGEGYRAFLAKQKKLSARRFPRKALASQSSRAQADPPRLQRSFAGNTTPIGIPLDTHMAISDSGQIVTVINFSVKVMDTSGTQQSQRSLSNFFAGSGVLGTLFDPKVHYDPDWDRYILCALSRTDTTTHIYLAFSQTNDANGNWNLYRLSGNPLNNNTWFDYPMLSISTEEVFLTGNSIRNDEPWQTGFEETLIFQIDKKRGYAGDSLQSRVWSDIKFGILTLRNLCPIKGATGNYGPNHYFLSNRNFDVLNQAFFIVEVTDSLNAPNVSLTVEVRGSDVPYGLPPGARQDRARDSLDTNDSRVLDGFLFDNKIQFVSNSIDTTNGQAGIYHGIIDDVSNAKFITGHILSDPVYEYGYPSIAYTGEDHPAAGDFDALIFFDFVAIQHPPTTGAIYYDNSGAYSERIQSRVGLDFIDVLGGSSTSERWGDYTAVQRVYNNPGRVWAMGTYGVPVREAAPWVSEWLRPGPLASLSPTLSSREIKAYPSPAYDFVKLEFDLPTGSQHLSILLLDAQGKQVKTFYDFAPHQQGKFRFQFSTHPLSAGLYFVEVRNESEVLGRKKIVVGK